MRITFTLMPGPTAAVIVDLLVIVVVAAAAAEIWMPG